MIFFNERNLTNATNSPFRGLGADLLFQIPFIKHAFGDVGIQLY